eukprot:366278_1
MSKMLIVTVTALFTVTYGIGRGYIKETTALSWQAANDACNTKYGTTLATVIDDDDKAAYLEASGGSSLWVGLSDIGEEGIWQWADNTACTNPTPGYGTTTNQCIDYWSTNQPDNAGNLEDCMHIRGGPELITNDHQCAGPRPYMCNAGSCDTELASGFWDGKATFSIEDTGTRINQGNYIETKKSYTRPIVVEAEMRSAAHSECISMNLFAQDHGKNTPYSFETGGWANKLRIFPGDYREDLEKGSNNNDWDTIKIDANQDGNVYFYLNGVLIYTAPDDSKQSGTIQFVPGCVDMLVRNVRVVFGGSCVFQGGTQPVDCVLGEWYNDGECSTLCGTGIQNQKKDIITPAENEGDCGATTQQIACNTQSCCPNGINTFNWDTMIEEHINAPSVEDLVFGVDSTDLTLNIYVELPYLGKTSADNQREAKFGTTYVIDFEDFNAHSDAINEPGTCQNRMSSSFTGKDFNDFWTYSLEPQNTNGIGNLNTLSYPPSDKWSISMK